VTGLLRSSRLTDPCMFAYVSDQKGLIYRVEVIDKASSPAAFQSCPLPPCHPYGVVAVAAG